MGKYSTLAQHLSTITEHSAFYSFEEIENILGFPLPKSARKYRPWWSNDTTHVQAKEGWLTQYWSVHSLDFPQQFVGFTKQKKNTQKHKIIQTTKQQKITPTAFETLSRTIMSSYLKTNFTPGQLPKIPKLFDLVSTDKTIIGDAKYLTTTKQSSTPAAKFSAIAEYVWLLEKTKAKTKFIVFGNNKKVPMEWLQRYHHLTTDVQFYFINKNNQVEQLH